MMQQYKGYWISGTAKITDATSWVWYVAGDVCRRGRGTSIVEATRFELPSFSVEDKDLAEFFVM